MPSVMEILSVAIMGGVIALFFWVFKSVLTEVRSLSNRMVYIETKVDIYLAHTGFDLNKVNRAIKEHKEELEQNNKPSVGCIHIKELYQDTGG